LIGEVEDNELFDTNLLIVKFGKQVPIISQDKSGLFVIAMSLEGASIVLQNLQK
jgi:hypothetical protein